MEPQPDPMLAVDQNRWTVVDRVVSEWGDRLAVSTAGLPRTALREMLESLRADHLLAASLAGSLDGLRDVLARALTATEGPEARPASAKAIGDTTQDLVYTPVVPCRIVDTRAAGGALQPMAPRVFDGYNAVSFAFQGGKSTNCGIPNGIAALAMNVYAVNPTNVGLIKVWPQGQPEPDVSTVNYQAGLVAIATGTIVPVNTANLNRFNARARRSSTSSPTWLVTSRARVAATAPSRSSLPQAAPCGWSRRRRRPTSSREVPPTASNPAGSARPSAGVARRVRTS